MTDKRPSDWLLREWDLDPKPKQPEPENDQQREATRLELKLNTPEPDPNRGPEIQAPGMGRSFVNRRAVETPEQRAARAREDQGREQVPPPEPPTREQMAERVREIDEGRPVLELLPSWMKDPRGG